MSFVGHMESYSSDGDASGPAGVPSDVLLVAAAQAASAG